MADLTLNHIIAKIRLISVKRQLLFLLPFFLPLMLTACGTVQTDGDPDTKHDAVIARIGSTEINAGQLEEQCRFMALVSEIDTEGMEQDEQEEYEQIILDHMVETILIRDYLDGVGVEVMTAEVEADAQYFMDSIRLNADVAEQLEDLGISDETVRDYYSSERYLDAFIGRMAAEDQELEAAALRYFEAHSDELVEVETNHIFAPTYEEASEIKGLLDQGADFGLTAKQRSRDVTAQTGGYNGPHLLDSLDSGYADAVLQMEPNQISGPVKTGEGYYIVQLIARRDRYEDFDETIKKTLAGSRLDVYIQRLKAQEVIEYFNLK